MTTKTKSTMIILSTLLLGIVLGLLLGGAIRGRKKADFERMPQRDRFHRSMERIIQPTTKQKTEMDTILKQRYERIGELREKYEEEIFAVFDSMRTDLNAVLTEEQRTRLEKKLAEGPKHLVDRRLERLTEDLQLTAEQREKVRKLALEYFRPKPGNTKGFPRPHGKDFKREMRNKMEKFQNEFRSILTKEQFEKFEASNHRGFFSRRSPNHEREMPPPHNNMPPPPPGFDE